MRRIADALSVGKSADLDGQKGRGLAPPETQRAAELLADRGVIEIRKAENQYRIKPKN
jgi:hypothetical protein